MRKGPGEATDLFGSEPTRDDSSDSVGKCDGPLQRGCGECGMDPKCLGNQEKFIPAYVVNYSQTPCAFPSSFQLKNNITLLGQARTGAGDRHTALKMDLRDWYPGSLKATTVFKQCNQTFETHNSTTPLQARILELEIHMDSRIIHDNRLEKETLWETILDQDKNLHNISLKQSPK